jgi:hypothetical protein
VKLNDIFKSYTIMMAVFAILFATHFLKAIFVSLDALTGAANCIIYYGTVTHRMCRIDVKEIDKLRAVGLIAMEKTGTTSSLYGSFLWIRF